MNDSTGKGFLWRDTGTGFDPDPPSRGTLVEDRFRAFYAGFKASAEGFNGEYGRHGWKDTEARLIDLYREWQSSGLDPREWWPT